jgi:hypothetical protein
MVAALRVSSSEVNQLEKETEDIGGGTAPRIALVCVALHPPITPDLSPHESSMMLTLFRHPSTIMRSDYVPMLRVKSIPCRAWAVNGRRKLERVYQAQVRL